MKYIAFLNLLIWPRFERISSNLFSIVLDILHVTQVSEKLSSRDRPVDFSKYSEYLQGHDPDMNYKFESADATSLLQESVKSQRLVGFCRLNNSQGATSAL